MGRRKQSTLAQMPTKVGKLWQVIWPGGTEELYESLPDACRAQQAAAEESKLQQRLKTIKASWARKLKQAAAARGKEFGRVTCELASLPADLYELLLDQAMQQ